MKTMKEGRRIASMWTATLFLAATACAVGEQSTPEEEQLKASLEYEKVSNGIYVALVNTSGEFFCLEYSQFDTARGSISLRDASGASVPVRIIREPGPPVFSRGFNFAVPYLFLQPGERRKIYIDIDTFITTPTKYQYEILLSYYLCRDITDQLKVRSKKDIESYSSQSEGWLDLGLRDH